MKVKIVIVGFRFKLVFFFIDLVVFGYIKWFYDERKLQFKKRVCRECAHILEDVKCSSCVAAP
jgi:hypothetical protein